MNNALKKLWIGFIIFGLLFGLVPTILSKYFITNKYTLETEANIVKIETRWDDIDDEYDHTVYVTYIIDGKTYLAKLNSYSSSYYEGKHITVLVDPNNYYSAMDKSMRNFIPVTFSSIGSVFLIIGLIGYVVVVSKQNKIERLRMSGSTIVADYEGTRMNYAYSVNGRHPYNVYCTWIDPNTQRKYYFKSENVWTDITHEIEGRHIDKFRVFVNPNNFNEYLVDIDNIKNDIM